MRIKLLLLLVLLFAFTAPAYAQGGVKSGPDPSTLRDPDLERDSKHNLEVAKNYFKLKKAYVASLKRCEEIIAGNPNFENAVVPSNIVSEDPENIANVTLFSQKVLPASQSMIKTR